MVSGGRQCASTDICREGPPCELSTLCSSAGALLQLPCTCPGSCLRMRAGSRRCCSASTSPGSTNCRGFRRRLRCCPRVSLESSGHQASK